MIVKRDGDYEEVDEYGGGCIEREGRRKDLGASRISREVSDRIETSRPRRGTGNRTDSLRSKEEMEKHPDGHERRELLSTLI